MRELTVDERSLVAGGLLTEVTAWGDRYYYYEDLSLFVADLGGDFGGGGYDEEAPPPDRPCINDLLGMNGRGALNGAWGELFKNMSSDHLHSLAEQISKLKSDTFPPVRGIFDSFVYAEAKELLDTMITDIKEAAGLPADERVRWGQNFADQLSWLPSIVAWKAYIEKFFAGSSLVRRCG
jgi:hypothetical protein